MEPSSKSAPTRSCQGSSLAFVSILVVSILALGFLYQPPLVDDAFITFRYADFLRRGHGLLYNVLPAEGGLLPVLGTTAPGFAIVLALLSQTGISIPALSIAIGWLGFLGCSLIAAQMTWKAMNLGPVRFAAIPLLLLSTLGHLSAFSGMETGAYCLLVVGSLVALSSRRFPLAGVLSAVSALLRPDGIILCALTLYVTALHDRRKMLRVVLIGAPIMVLWAAYSVSTYGTFVPHSIEAKRLIHPGTALVNATAAIYFSLNSASTLILCGTGLVGLILGSAISHSQTVLLRISLAWTLLYAAGLCFSGVRPLFFWYYTPLMAISVAVGIPGLIQFARSNSSAPPLRSIFGATGASCFLISITAIVASEFFWRGNSLDQEQARHLVYQQLSQQIAAQSNKGQKIFLCETGIVGFAVPQLVVIDSAGINSQEVLEIRRTSPRGYFQKIVERFSPEWIVSPLDWCEVGQSQGESWFTDHYKQVMLQAPALLGGIAVYRRSE